jgi:type IV pilus assembly protein PilB
MVDMGVAPFSIATAVNLIIAQRLARRLCSACKRPIDIPKEALRKEGFTDEMIDSNPTFFEAVGCDACKEGYKGRAGIYQVMPMTEEMARCLMEGVEGHGRCHQPRRGQLGHHRGLIPRHT